MDGMPPSRCDQLNVISSFLSPCGHLYKFRKIKSFGRFHIPENKLDGLSENIIAPAILKW